MPTYKVQLADRPTAVVLALHEAGPLPWHVLRDQHGATSSDMNLLVDLGFVASNGAQWLLTTIGRDAVRPKEATT